MNSIKVIRPRSTPTTILITNIEDNDWYSYEDNSGIFYGNKERRMQVSHNHIQFITGGAGNMLAYRIEVEMTVNVGYVN